MHIKESKFLASYTGVEHCPLLKLPEYAFIGRSNVGKSSLINMLVGSNTLAKTSSTPGKTQLINLFLIHVMVSSSNHQQTKKHTNKNAGSGRWVIADLPGYGFAKISKQKREDWNLLISNYLRKRKELMTAFCLVDSRIEPQQIDIDFINSIGENHIPIVIVFTKSDKLSQKELSKNVNAVLNKLKDIWEELPPHIISSAVKKTGQEEMLKYIQESNKHYSI